MTSELRPAVEVAIRIHGYAPFGEGTKAAAAVIEADREAVREQTVAKIVAWLRTQDDPSEKWALQNSHWYAAEIEAGEHLK